MNFGFEIVNLGFLNFAWNNGNFLANGESMGFEGLNYQFIFVNFLYIFIFVINGMFKIISKFLFT